MPTTTVKPTRFLILYPYVPLNDTRGIAYPETCLPIKLQNRGQKRSTARYGHERQQKQCPQHVATNPIAIVEKTEALDKLQLILDWRKQWN